MWEVQKLEDKTWVVVEKFNDKPAADLRLRQLQQMFPEWSLRLKARMKQL